MIIFNITLLIWNLWGSDLKEGFDLVIKCMLSSHLVGESSPMNHLLDETSFSHLIVVVLVLENDCCCFGGQVCR